MITANDPYLVPPGGSRISRERFIKILRERANPGVIAERDPGQYFDAIEATTTDDGRHPDQLFVLAMFGKESTFGTKGVAVTTHSWGNTRTPNFGATPVGTHPGRTGTFPIWRDWLDGCKSTAARLAEDDYYYLYERRTIGQVFNDPVADNPLHTPAMPPIPRLVVNGKVQRIEWAPAGDKNDPQGYLAFMLRYMNENADMGETPMPTSYDHIIPDMIDARGHLATATPGQGGVTRGPYERTDLSKKRGVVVHYRGVQTAMNAGLSSFKSDATYHVGKNWASNGEAPILGSGIMYHIGIDGEGNVYLLRDLDRVLWHCGAWPQNENTLAIQLPLGGNQKATAKQLESLNRVVDAWLAFTKAPRSEVWGHKELSSTTCPGTLMDDFVKPYRAGTPAPTGDPLSPNPSVPDHRSVRNPYGKFFVPIDIAKRIRQDDEEQGLDAVGYVRSGAFIEDDKLVVYTQRRRYERHRDGRIYLGLLGLEVFDERYPNGAP